MNSEKAKKLSLPDILAKLGYTPAKTVKAGNEIWYNSPFRNDTTPSFHTSYLGGKWIWNDFGDIGGTVIDFAMRYKNTNVAGALDFLERLMGNQYYTSNQQSLFSAPTAEVTSLPVPTPSEVIETLSIVKISPISVNSFNGRGLLQYLTNERGIKQEIAVKYLVEVQYRNNENGKTYFAAGIKNTHGGYEIRNKYFKSSIGQKGITFIKGQGVEGKAAVFEGFMDFLSALTYYHSKDIDNFRQLLESDVVIMNSASFHQQTIEQLKANQYSHIALYLDNDTTGKKISSQLQAELPSITEDFSTLYQEYKDFNQFLTGMSKGFYQQP